MKSFYYYLFFFVFAWSSLHTESSHVILLLETLTQIQQEQPHLFGDQAIGQLLNDLEQYVEMVSPPLDNSIREDVQKKIFDFQELHTLYQKRAPRLNAHPESRPLNVDSTYFNVRDEYLRNLIECTG